MHIYLYSSGTRELEVQPQAHASSEDVIPPGGRMTTEKIAFLMLISPHQSMTYKLQRRERLIRSLSLYNGTTLRARYDRKRNHSDLWTTTLKKKMLLNQQTREKTSSRVAPEAQKSQFSAAFLKKQNIRKKLIIRGKNTFSLCPQFTAEPHFFLAFFRQRQTSTSYPKFYTFYNIL